MAEETHLSVPSDVSNNQLFKYLDLFFVLLLQNSTIKALCSTLKHYIEGNLNGFWAVDTHDVSCRIYCVSYSFERRVVSFDDTVLRCSYSYLQSHLPCLHVASLRQRLTIGPYWGEVYSIVIEWCTLPISPFMLHQRDPVCSSLHCDMRRLWDQASCS